MATLIVAKFGRDRKDVQCMRQGNPDAAPGMNRTPHRVSQARE
jgi:hypothetical protein